MTYPTWRCDCESDDCMATCGHVCGACKKTGANAVVMFGMKQNLCDDCLTVAQRKYGDELENAQ
jgi:hypothetical protein